MKNFGYCKYTYIHRKVIFELINKYIKDIQLREEMLKRAKIHDMDKMTSYLLYDKNICSKIHRENNSHHVSNNLEKTYYDYVEMILDWESARYSKKDKPLNAYQTLYKYYPELEKEILPILREYNLDSENIEMDKYILDMILELEDIITEDDIIIEIINYIKDIKKEED